MVKPPKEFSRVTRKKKSAHQLYQPGFNPANGCWLEGSWVTLPEAEWLEKKDAHVATYQGVFRVAQSHRGAAVPLDQLTAWQRQAYEHYSGQVTAHVEAPNGIIARCVIDMAGSRPQTRDLAFLRKNGYRILPRIRNGYTGEITSQVEGYDFPEDVVAFDWKSVPDPWSRIVRQNVDNERSMYLSCFGNAAAEPLDLAEGMFANFDLFSVSLGMGGLMSTEESIIRTEWERFCGKRDPYADLEGDVAFYVKLRARAKEVLKDKFDAAYAKAKASHNSCARSNLGDRGVSFSFVLPEFRDDGSHDPWGARDVPWRA